jgi:hypothetical protein
MVYQLTLIAKHLAQPAQTFGKTVSMKYTAETPGLVAKDYIEEFIAGEWKDDPVELIPATTQLLV